MSIIKKKSSRIPLISAGGLIISLAILMVTFYAYIVHPNYVENEKKQRNLVQNKILPLFISVKIMYLESELAFSEKLHQERLNRLSLIQDKFNLYVKFTEMERIHMVQDYIINRNFSQGAFKNMLKSFLEKLNKFMNKSIQEQQINERKKNRFAF